MHNGAVFVSRKRPLLNSGTTIPIHPDLTEGSAFRGGGRFWSPGLDGTARFDGPMALDPELPLAGDLVDVELAGKIYKISSSRRIDGSGRVGWCVFLGWLGEGFFRGLRSNFHLLK